MLLAFVWWTVSIDVPPPSKEVIRPGEVVLRFTSPDEGISGERLADEINLLLEPPKSTDDEATAKKKKKMEGLRKQALYKGVVAQAAERIRKVELFESDSVFDGSDWKANGEGWESTIQPTPLGPVKVRVMGQESWSIETRPSFSDEFQWRTDVASWSDHWSWSADHVVMDGGSLKIKTTYDPHERDGKTISYKSGIVKSKDPQLYGYFEARIKGAAKYPGVCPAFWLYNNAGDHATEIDIVELTQEGTEKTMWFSQHVFILPGETEKKQRSSKHPIEADFDPRDDFHVYACHWTKNAIVWYVDEKEVARETNINHHQPLYVSLSMGIRQPLYGSPSGDGFPTEMEVDYVRIWKDKK